jgi:hypothetical protein
MNLSQGKHKLRLKMYMKEKIRFKKIAKMTVTENWDYGHLSKQLCLTFSGKGYVFPEPEFFSLHEEYFLTRKISTFFSPDFTKIPFWKLQCQIIYFLHLYKYIFHIICTGCRNHTYCFLGFIRSKWLTL